MKGLEPYGSGTGSSLSTLLQFRNQVFTIFPLLKILSQYRCVDLVEEALVIPG